MVHARSRSRAVTAFVMIVLCMGASVAACAEQKRANGDECIKNEECASLICSSMKCVAPPPLMEGNGTTNPGTDAGASDGSSGADSNGAVDSATGGGDASDDGPPVDQDTSVPDGADQDAADALLDVEVDTGIDSALADATADTSDVSDASLDTGGDALSDASDANAFDVIIFDSGFDANLPDVLGG